jgi:IS4 transposase
MQDGFNTGDLILGDAYYPTYYFLADMQAKGVDVLMEQYGSRRKNTDFKKGTILGKQNHIFTLKNPKKRPHWMSIERYDSMVNELQIREFKVGKKIRVTTLMNNKKYHPKELNELYKSRWNIELDIRNIKTTMGMDILSCKTPEMAIKEIWIYCLAYNLIRWLMLQSALLTNILPRQISFKHSLQLSLTLADQVQHVSDDMMIQFLTLIAQQQQQ